MNREYHFIANAVKFIGSTLVVYLFFKRLLPVVFPFFAAFFLAGLLNPVKIRWMNRCKGKNLAWQNNLISILLILLVVLLIGGSLVFLGYFLMNQIRELWGARENWLDDLQKLWYQIEGSLGPGITRQLRQKFSVEDLLEGGMDKLFAQAAKGIQLVKGTFGGFINIVVLLVAAYLLLKDYEAYHRKIMKSPLGEVLLALGGDLKKAGGSYLKAQLIIMGIVIVECVLGMLLIGNPYALLAGILIGICDALPFLGTGVIFLPWALIDFLWNNTTDGILLLLFTGITTVTRQFLEPKLIGNSIGANPFLVLVSIYLGIQFFGLWGFLLGPMAAFLIWEMYQFL